MKILFRFLIIKVFNFSILILSIAYKSLTILDKEEEEDVVEENYDNFKKLYQPIWNDTFKNVFSISEDGKVSIKHDLATRKYLMSHINDNVLQNLTDMSVISYDHDDKYHKSMIDPSKKK